MKLNSNLTLFAIVIAVVLLGGCSTPEPEPTPDPAEQAALAEQRVDLIATSWEVESFGGADDSLAVLPDTKLTLNMLAERYAGYNGCNWFVGVYDVDGSEMTFYTPAVTAFICPDEAVSAQGATYLSALTNVTEYEMEGEKLVTYTVGDQKMATFVSAEPVALEGTEWTAKFVNDGERMVPASDYEFTVSAVFENGKVTGNGGCNDYEADYVVDGSSIAVSNITSAGAECTENPGSNNVESWYFAALEGTTSWAALVTSMAFMGDEGQDMVFFGTP